MKTLLRTLALAGLCGLATASAHAGVSVTFDQSHHYADVPFSGVDRKQVLDQLADHFTSLGQYLPPGQELHIVVTDIDLAGRRVPNYRSGEDVRVVTGRGDAPRIDLRYTLEQDGRVAKQGQAELLDMSYQMRTNRYFSNEALRYEKQMIDEWFSKNFASIDRR